MGGISCAVLIGIDDYRDARFFNRLRYAEKDCTDFYKLLTDPEISDFLPGNVHMLLGAEATTRAIEGALFRHVVRDRSPEDRVLVYFSGHGFIAGDEGLAYLGSQDVLVSDLRDNPYLGLRMDRIHDEVFVLSRARNVIFVLDCCHSGALTPPAIRHSTKATVKELVRRDFFLGSNGRIAIVACPPNEVSRESEDLQNGILTHFLLRGLKGDAVEGGSGEVTLDSLMSYVRSHTPSEQPPGCYGQSFGRIVLTTPGISAAGTAHGSAISASAETPKNVGAVCPLSNPLEPYVPFIDRLVSELTSVASTTELPVDQRILDVVCRTLDADLAFVIRSDRNSHVMRSRSTVRGQPGDPSHHLDVAFARARSILDEFIRPRHVYHSVGCSYDDNTGSIKRTKKTMIVAATCSHDANEYLVLTGLSAESRFLDDVCSHILTALYTATRRFTTLQPQLIEAMLLDGLKEHFLGHVPIAIYERRFRLFRDRLKQIAVFFQPIVKLEPGRVHIAGWEALARDKDSMMVPSDLFSAAEIWGRQFLTELDLYIIWESTQTYRDALSRAAMRRPADVPPLSVNVYPASLMRAAYLERLREALATYELSDKVILEVSEKLAIPDEAANLRTFKRRLQDYVRHARVSFAIDDFGVGYSSIERLGILKPAYVKIDREILHLEASEQAIEFVLNMTAHGGLSPTTVVVEGFDGTSHLTLGQLYRIGVRHVQGYALGKAGSEIYRLTREENRHLEGLLDLDQRG